MVENNPLRCQKLSSLKAALMSRRTVHHWKLSVTVKLQRNPDTG